MMIEWTPDKLHRFKEVFEEHKDDRDSVFVFEGAEFLSSYARYLIEYLDCEFKKAR